ncbi:branched-chain amino acid transaminase [filamentous cyanobacterium LEGE 11480]|uniref:Branched-chain-amino-acid aminotransferase n=1 Tax=Romeriopsis navalis LEGE 11480 TaxID=2777977 RepID=A0A928VP68_9CYAN|nr:branched-chain amino acid transaminase [Romeriopsis navalis]MBE9030007.1 branched-chain amino acid transaminase [Romeriopsis navalis LEGE 11480]
MTASTIAAPTAAQSLTFLPQAYFQGKLVPFAQAQISIATHALHYGTAVLGGIRGWPSQSGHVSVFRLDAHCQRLSHSAKYLNYTVTAAELQATIIHFIQQNRPQQPFYIRPLIYTSSLGIAPRVHAIDKDLLIYGVEMDAYLSGDGVRCRISSWSRQEDRSQPLRGKSSAAYIASALAKSEAIESGFDEAIMLNSQGKVSEASAMNIFIVRNGQLITPSIDQDILEGITRDSVMTLARGEGIPVIEQPVDKSELVIADEVFLCGTAAQITPVLRIENQTFTTARPITRKLQAAMQTVLAGAHPHHAAWLTKITID